MKQPFGCFRAVVVNAPSFTCARPSSAAAEPRSEEDRAEARGINPFAYLADVIPRVQDHPKRRLDELLPGPWARARADA